MGTRADTFDLPTRSPSLSAIRCGMGSRPCVSIAPWAYGLISAFALTSALWDLLVPAEARQPMGRLLVLSALLGTLAVSGRRRTLHRVVLTLAWGVILPFIVGWTPDAPAR